MRFRVLLATIAVGVGGLLASCIYMENPYWEDQLFYGYPFLWLETSKSLLVEFPPIPRRIIVLPGFFVDLSLYLSVGLVVSYMVFTLNENMRLLRFFLKSGAVFVVGSFFAGLLLTGSGPTPGVGPIGVGVQLVFIYSLPATFVCTIAYGYYRLLMNWRAKKISAPAL